MRILYLHSVATFGGSSKSLIELFSCLLKFGVEGVVLAPRGSACNAFLKAGLEVNPVRGLSQFDNTRYGYYRRLRWLILLRELFYLPYSIMAIWRLRNERFDILHINDVTLLPLGILAKKLLDLPMVVHVRSLQCLPDSNWRTKLINRWLSYYADAIIPIDHSVANTLDKALSVNIIHNGLRINTLAPSQGRMNYSEQPVRVGFLGVLIPLKGIYELVEAMRILKNRGVIAECIVVGEAPRELRGIQGWLMRKLGFVRNVREELDQLITQYGLRQHVQFLGFVEDVHVLYPTLDILCFPSHLNAAGRPVFEAAFYEIPSVIAVNAPFPDTVLHKQTGLAIPEPLPELIAAAIQRLVEDKELRLALGRRARTWAIENFSIETSTAQMLDVYHRLLEPHARGY